MSEINCYNKYIFSEIEGKEWKMVGGNLIVIKMPLSAKLIQCKRCELKNECEDKTSKIYSKCRRFTQNGKQEWKNIRLKKCC